MTWNDLNPLSNPFSSKRSFQINTGNGNPRSLQVPNQDIPLYGYDEWFERVFKQSSLTVPNQDIPLGDQTCNYGFINGRADLFRLHDGTIMNWKTGKIVFQKKNDSQYWNDPDQTITFNDSEIVSNANTVKNELTLNELINNVEKYYGTAMPNGEILEPLDQKSAAYWLKAEEEAEKLKANMTPEQIKAIEDFEKHFPKSKLIEESKQYNKGKII